VFSTLAGAAEAFKQEKPEQSPHVPPAADLKKIKEEETSVWRYVTERPVTLRDLRSAGWDWNVPEAKYRFMARDSNEWGDLLKEYVGRPTDTGKGPSGSKDDDEPPDSDEE